MKITITEPVRRLTVPGNSSSPQKGSKKANSVNIIQESDATELILNHQFQDRYYSAAHYHLNNVNDLPAAQLELNEQAIILMYVLQGNLTIHISKLHKPAIKQGAYSLFAFKKGKYRLALNKGEHEAIVIMLHSSIINLLADTYQELKKTQEQLKQTQNHLANQQQISPFLNHLLLKFRSSKWQPEDNNVLRETLILSIIMESLSSRESSNKTSIILQADNDKKFQNVKEYIHINLGKKLDLSKIAEKLNALPDTLRKGFKRTYGYSILSYIREKRMQQAAILLKETSLPVQEIAWEVGYESAAGFNRIFSLHFGISPGEYRARSQTLPSISANS